MNLLVPYISFFLSRRISSSLRHCLVSWSQCRKIFGNSPSPPIPGPCDMQARRCCSGLNLGDKRTYFTAQVIHLKNYHVREFRHYYVWLYYNCNFNERQALFNCTTPHKPDSSAASSAEWPRRKCSKKKDICNGIALCVSGFHSLLLAWYLCVNNYRYQFRTKDRCKPFAVLYTDPIVS